MTQVIFRLTAKNRDQLRNPTLGNRVWATFTVCDRQVWVDEHIDMRLTLAAASERQRDGVPWCYNRDDGLYVVMLVTVAGRRMAMLNITRTDDNSSIIVRAHCCRNYCSLESPACFCCIVWEHSDVQKVIKARRLFLCSVWKGVISVFNTVTIVISNSISTS